MGGLYAEAVHSFTSYSQSALFTLQYRNRSLFRVNKKEEVQWLKVDGYGADALAQKMEGLGASESIKLFSEFVSRFQETKIVGRRSVLALSLWPRGTSKSKLRFRTGRFAASELRGNLAFSFWPFWFGCGPTKLRSQQTGDH